MITPERLKGIPMLRDLQVAELAEISRCFTEQSISAGEALYIEGEPATSACFLVSGQLEVLKALPGGDSAQITVLEPGSMIGEMALLADGTRTATVRATTDTVVVTVLREFFHAALDQISVPAYKILRRVMHNMAVRFDEHQQRILQQWDCEACIPRADGSDSAVTVETEDPAQSPSFAFRDFLPVVPFFALFTGSETDRLLARAKVAELPRGTYLYREAAVAQSCYVVIRGAVETSVTRDRRYQLSVLGPGRLCGANALIMGERHSSDARVRSAALLLCFDRAAFHDLYEGDDAECLKFQRMISRNQLQDRKVADNLLSTLLRQDCVSDGIRHHGL